MPAIMEAALGVGMTPRQSLFTVELPLALPVMMAGIRTAAVWVIGTATLSTPIGQTSLGNYIFAGLQTQNWVFVLFGCLAAAVLALAVDQLLALIEIGLRHRSRLRAALGRHRHRCAGRGDAGADAVAPQASYVIGAKTFAEQYVLAALIGAAAAAAGLSATTREGLGSNVIFDALARRRYRRLCRLFRHDLDQPVPPQRHQAARGAARRIEDHAGEAEHHAARRTRLRERLCAGDAAQARRSARHPHASPISPRARRTLSIAGDYEFFSRPEWAALRKTYGLSFREQRQMQPDFMYAAAASGEVDVIAGYTSDGLIAKYDLVVLDDPRHAIPPYDAMVLLAPKRADDQALRTALQPLLGKIDIATMREANLRAAATTPRLRPMRWRGGCGRRWRRSRGLHRHCDERSDEAIHTATRCEIDCFASLAMTGMEHAWMVGSSPAMAERETIKAP